MDAHGPRSSRSLASSAARARSGENTPHVTHRSAAAVPAAQAQMPPRRDIQSPHAAARYAAKNAPSRLSDTVIPSRGNSAAGKISAPATEPSVLHARRRPVLREIRRRRLSDAKKGGHAHAEEKRGKPRKQQKEEELRPGRHIEADDVGIAAQHDCCFRARRALRPQPWRRANSGRALLRRSRVPKARSPAPEAKMIAAVTPEYSSDVSRKNRPSQRSAHASQPMNTSPERKAAAYSMRGRARLLRPLRNFHGKRTPRKREHDRAEGQIARRRHAVREGHPEKADAERSRKERSRARAERVHARTSTRARAPPPSAWQSREPARAARRPMGSEASSMSSAAPRMGESGRTQRVQRVMSRRHQKRQRGNQHFQQTVQPQRRHAAFRQSAAQTASQRQPEKEHGRHKRHRKQRRAQREG